MKSSNLFILAVALILGCAGLAFASQSPKTTTASSTTKSATKTTIHHEWGTIESVSDSSLTLDHTWKGKKEQTNFMLNSGTKKEGDLEKGAHATVYYEMNNKDRVATDVKVAAMKSAAKKSATTKKS
jgi:hypothetical protein